MIAFHDNEDRRGPDGERRYPNVGRAIPAQHSDCGRITARKLQAPVRLAADYGRITAHPETSLCYDYDRAFYPLNRIISLILSIGQ